MGLLAEAGRSPGSFEWMLYGLPPALVLTFLACRMLVRSILPEARPLSLERPGHTDHSQ